MTVVYVESKWFYASIKLCVPQNEHARRFQGHAFTENFLILLLAVIRYILTVSHFQHQILSHNIKLPGIISNLHCMGVLLFLFLKKITIAYNLKERNELPLPLYIRPANAAGVICGLYGSS